METAGRWRDLAVPLSPDTDIQSDGTWAATGGILAPVGSSQTDDPVAPGLLGGVQVGVRPQDEVVDRLVCFPGGDAG